MALTDDVSVRDGAVFGGIAWIVGIALTAVLGYAGANSTLGLLISFLGFLGSLVGYFYFHTWFVFDSQVGGLAVFTLLPVVLLVAAGYVAASRTARGTSGTVAGTSVAIGYLALAIVSILVAVFLAGGSGGSGLTLNAQSVLGLLLTGVAFPVVFGAVGGAIADGS